MRGFTVRGTGLGESGRHNGLGNKYDRIHQQTLTAREKCLSRVTTWPTRILLQRRLLGTAWVLCPLPKCPSLFLVIVMFTQEKMAMVAEMDAKPGPNAAGVPLGQVNDMVPPGTRQPLVGS